jgi:hypothetical protein
MLHRLLPPASGPMQSMVVNGRNYAAQPGSAIDAPDMDSGGLQAAGWIYVSPSGPTSARPTGTVGLYPAVAGARFFDTTLGELIVFDGATWRDPVTGARRSDGGGVEAGKEPRSASRRGE